MEHVFNATMPHYEVLLDWYLEEYRTGGYKK